FITLWHPALHRYTLLKSEKWMGEIMSLGSAVNQMEIFLREEGDGWYERNKSAIENGDRKFDEEIMCQTLLPFKPKLNRILEIGCSSGFKLERLCDRFDALGMGI